MDNYIAMDRRKTLYLGILLGVYLLLIGFPTYLFTKDLYVLYGVELGLRSAFLVFIIIFSIFSKIAKRYNGKTRFTNLFLLLPLFFVAFFNLFYLAVVTKSTVSSPFGFFASNGNNTLELLKFFCVIITVVEEELLFRYIIQRNLAIGHKVVRIVVTAAIFVVAYFFTMLYDARGVLEPIYLLELIFTFGVGVILGFLYEYTNNIAVPIVFSFFYMVCNEMIYNIDLIGASYKFYITATCFFVGAAAYLLIFYFLMLKRDQR